MEPPSFCVAPPSEDEPAADEATSMDLDAAAALAELKILTEDISKEKHQRKTSCKVNDEKWKKLQQLPKSCSNSAPVCVVQMNPKFVTNFSVSKSSNDVPGWASRWTDIGPKARPSKSRLCRKYKPYPIASVSKCHDIPSQLRLEDLSVGPLPALAAERASSPAMPRQDSGNKSNPSSPAKSQNCLLSTTGSSIIRSRSLDDIEISKLEDSKLDCYCYGRCDIDTVSQHISKLHVS